MQYPKPQGVGAPRKPTHMPLVEHRYPLSMVGGRGGSDMREERKTEVIIVDVFVIVCQNCMYRILILSTNNALNLSI